MVGLQSWHSSIHFYIPITLAILTFQLDLALTVTLAWQAQLYVNAGEVPPKKLYGRPKWHLTGIEDFNIDHCLDVVM